MKKNKLSNKFNICIGLIAIVSFITFSISFFNIITWKIDSKKTLNQVKIVQEQVDIKEVIEEDHESIEIIEQEEPVPQFDPYWGYIKMNLINVDIGELKIINNDIKGWIQVNGTNINYPFVQTKDNKYYLTRSFDRSYNQAGWVFLDYRNNIEELNKNNVLYAHGRYDGTMFGSLKNILESGWVNDTNNHIIKLSTDKHNTMWQVFSVYKIPTTNDYIQVNFSSNEEFLEFGNKLIERSSYKFNTSISAIDKILTLSTCYNDNEKVVLHAKLIKIDNKNNIG